jgi:hypothetical protein
MSDSGSPQAMVVTVRPERVRSPAARSAGSALVRLWGLLGVVAVSALLVFLSVDRALSDSSGALHAVGWETAPAIDDALGISLAVSDMDAAAADYLLLDGGSTGSLTPSGVLNRYEQRRQAASDLLIAAARSPTYDATEHTAILRMLVMLQVFDADVEKAEVLDDRGDRVDAVAAYEQATDLVHAPQNGLLETGLGLAASLHDDLTTRSDAARAQQGRDTRLIALSLSLAVVVLAWLQVLQFERTRRLVSIPLAGATLLAMGLLAASILTLRASGDHLAAARNGFDSVYALRQVRGIAFDARADESRYLIDAPRAQVSEASFLDKSVELASFRQPVTIATYDSTLGDHLAAMENGEPADIGGALGRTLAGVSLPGEGRAAAATLDAYGRFQRDDRVLRSDWVNGNVVEAIRFYNSPAPNDSGGDFAAFDSALGAWMRIHQQAFDEQVAAGTGDLDRWQVYAAIGALLIAVLAGLGIRP